MLLALAICGGGAPKISAAALDGLDVAPLPQQLTPAGQALLRHYLDAGQLPDLCWSDFSAYRADAAKFYAAFGNALPWVQEGKPTHQALTLIRDFQNAEYKGLSPEDYDGSRWAARLARFNQPAIVSEADLVPFDLEITVSAMRYLSDLKDGRINPRSVHFDISVDHTHFDLSGFLSQEIVASQDVEAIISSIEPPFAIYHRTENALATYIELSKEGESAALSIPRKPVKPGMAYTDSAALAARLKFLGDLSQDFHLAAETYQGALVDAVRHFQTRHGLQPSGVVDGATVKELNTPLSARAGQLALTMERIRWVRRDFSRPPIVVNIPEFSLHVDNEQYHWALSMKVVVGKAYRHKTPVFESQIGAVIFRPYWNVPLSIARTELIPHIQKEASYLTANDYEIVDKRGEIISREAPSAELLARVASGELRIRQRPGPKNALGLVKFDIPSSYGVYMHGTPATELFSRSRRDFSHGCIRVEDPVVLAKWVLQGQGDWNEEKILAAMNGDATLEVGVKNAIPVLIVYGTAVVMENGEAHFFRDIYGLDAALEKALGARHSVDIAETPKGH